MRALYALICLAIAYPALAHPAIGAGLGIAGFAAAHLTLTLTVAAVVLLARHRPHHPHRLITALAGATIAALVTGHRATA